MAISKIMVEKGKELEATLILGGIFADITFKNEYDGESNSEEK